MSAERLAELLLHELPNVIVEQRSGSGIGGNPEAMVWGPSTRVLTADWASRLAARLIAAGVTLAARPTPDTRRSCDPRDHGGKHASWCPAPDTALREAAEAVVSIVGMYSETMANGPDIAALRDALRDAGKEPTDE